MKKQIPNRYPVTITFATLMLLLACTMPLGEILISPIGAESLGDGGKILILKTWNSNLIIKALKIPNWLLIVSAVSILALTWLNAYEIWKSHVLMPLGFATYGLIHGFGLIFVLVSAPNTTLGFGSLLATLGFLVLLYTISRNALIHKSNSP